MNGDVRDGLPVIATYFIRQSTQHKVIISIENDHKLKRIGLK